MLSPDMNLRLNRQMTAEYYSFWLYTAMSGWAASKNRHGFAHWLALQAEEEKRHAERFFHYIIERHGTIQLDGIPKPPEQWDSFTALFTMVLEQERGVTAAIFQLAEAADAEGDRTTGLMLDWFIEEQAEEESQSLNLLEKVQAFSDFPAAFYALDREVALRSDGNKLCK